MTINIEQHIQWLKHCKFLVSIYKEQRYEPKDFGNWGSDRSCLMTWAEKKKKALAIEMDLDEKIRHFQSLKKSEEVKTEYLTSEN